jgi:uncharacterized protein (DUF1697 family)
VTSRWVAFLRAINTGNRRVTGDRLVSIFESIGLFDVSSFQASGNVLFTAGSPDLPEIERALEDGLGYEVPTALRSGDDVREIGSAVPFDDAELDATQRRVQVIMVRNPPSQAVLDSALSEAPAEDVLRARGSDIFWLPRGGISDSGLDLSGMERRLGPMTVRTHNTVRRLVTRL